MSHNDKYQELEKELQPYKKILSQASDIILNENVSKYPIFVVHQQELEMGILLIEAGTKLKWSVNVTTLEELVSKDIVFMDKSKLFIENFKDAESHLCLFVLSDFGAQFIFIPR